jgi:hypothetical protein
MMSEASLQQLERDVEVARARLVGNLTTLRSPSSFSEFKEGLKFEALSARDALIEQAQSTAQSTVAGIINDMKARAAANPAAVLAIGAGIAWQLIRHPPIATALIGTGLYSLLRTTPADNGSGRQIDYFAQAKQRLGEQVGDVAAIAREQAMDLAAVAKEQALDMAGTVQEQAGGLADRAKEKVQQWRDDARQAVGHATSQVQGALGHATAEVQEQAALTAHRTSAAFGDARQIAEDAVARASASARRTAGRLTDDARQSAAELTARARMTAGHASSSVQQALNDQDLRDKVLIGVAGLAVAAALGIAYQRRQNEEA